jgi:hypothetical protein
MNSIKLAVNPGTNWLIVIRNLDVSPSKETGLYARPLRPCVHTVFEYDSQSATRSRIELMKERVHTPDILLAKLSCYTTLMRLKLGGYISTGHNRTGWACLHCKSWKILEILFHWLCIQSGHYILLPCLAWYSILSNRKLRYIRKIEHPLGRLRSNRLSYPICLLSRSAVQIETVVNFCNAELMGLRVFCVELKSILYLYIHTCIAFGRRYVSGGQRSVTDRDF